VTVDIDDLLRRSGEQWRARHSAPLALPDFEEKTVSAPRRGARRGFLIPMAAAAATVAVIAVVLVLRAPTGVPVAGGPTGTGSPAATAPGTPTPSDVTSPLPSSSVPTSPPARPADCAAAQLSGSVDANHTGTIAGAESVVILLRNGGPAACWLGGVPTLSGQTASGSTVPLGYAGSADPGYADPGPAGGPGPVAAGADGAIHLTLQVNNCSKPGTRYAKLLIQLRPGQVVSMPFPAELAVSGCPGYVAQAGPVVS
jgi:hypothetical protein